MPLEQPDFLKNNPYYDDFLDDKNFLKVLFKPGFAIQARELTQIQTILQSQISKFADHIFKEGSKVFGGNVTTSKLNYIRIEKQRIEPFGNSFNVLTNTFADTYLNTLKKENFIVSNNTQEYIGSLEHTDFDIFNPVAGNYNFSVKSGSVRLVHFLPSGFSENDDYTILFVVSTSGSNILKAESILKVQNSEIYFKVTENQNIDFLGVANYVTVDDGIYYSNGYFVNNKKQHTVAYTVSQEQENEESLRTGVLNPLFKNNVRLFNFSSNRIGLSVVKRTIDVTEDRTLRDPSRGFYNANAPGADRYKIELILTSLPFDFSSVEIENFANKDFIQLVRTIKGNVDWIQKVPNYSEILDLLARRTYDESGSYTVRPFPVEVKEHLKKDTFEIFVSNSIDETISAFYLQINGYVWQETSQTPENFSPFDPSFNLQEQNFPIAKIIDVIPFKESHRSDSSETGSISTTSTIFNKKILIEPLNQIRFSFTGTFQNFEYQKSSVSTIETINGRYLKYNFDSEGTYSVYDIPSGDINKSTISIQPGKAYVYGYELDFYSPTKIEYLKGRDPNIDVSVQDSSFGSFDLLGNYVVGNFVANDTAINTDEKINWEVLPKFELQSDDVFTLIMKNKITDQARGKVLSWTPFNRFLQTSDGRLMFGFVGENLNQEYESVIVISDIE